MSTRQSGYRASFAPSVGQPLGQSLSGPSRQSGYGGGFGASRTARESMFPVPSSEFLSSLDECVRATEGCVSAMDGALSTLSTGIEDFPRLNKLFEIEYGFLLVPEPHVLAKKSEYTASLQPYIDKLLDRSTELLDADKAKIARMEEQLALLENARANRLPDAPRLPGTFKNLDVAQQDKNKENFLEGIDLKKVSLPQRRKIAMLRTKRDRLEKERAKLMG